MMLKAYSLFDNKALQYHPPFFASTHGAASRMVADLVQDSNTTVGRHPADYILYCIGEYDDSKGLMSPYSPLVHVVDAISLVPIQSALPVAAQ